MSSITLAYVYVFICVTVLGIGQLMFKTVSERINGLQDILTDSKTFMVFVGALALYGISVLLWILALRTIPLSKAYPFMALGFLIVPIAAYFVFGEEINRMQILGMVIVVSGLVIVSSN